MSDLAQLTNSVVYAAAVAGVMALSGHALADETYTCLGTNTGLHFVVYEDGNTPRGGHMYINNIQVAVLDTRRINDISIRATVRSNTVNTEFVFNRSREKIYIELRDTSREVCDARVRDVG